MAKKRFVFQIKYKTGTKTKSKQMGKKVILFLFSMSKQDVTLNTAKVKTSNIEDVKSAVQIS